MFQLLILCISQIKGDWNLIEYITSVDGKPWPPHAPYLCPEQRMSVTIDAATKRMNISQVTWSIYNLHTITKLLICIHLIMTLYGVFIIVLVVS